MKMASELLGDGCYDSMDTGLAVGNDFEKIAGSGICAASDFSNIQEMLEARQQETKAALEALQEELKKTAKRRKRRDELGLQIPETETKIGQTEAALQELKAAGASLTAQQEAAEKQRDTGRNFICALLAKLAGQPILFLFYAVECNFTGISQRPDPAGKRVV